MYSKLSTSHLSLLQRVLQGQIQDDKIPNEQIGEEKEYKWRSSSVNHEPILINNTTGKMVAGVGMEARETSVTKPAKLTINITYTAEQIAPKGANTKKPHQKFWSTFADKLNECVKNKTITDASLAFIYQNLGQHVEVEKFSVADVGLSHIDYFDNSPKIATLKATDINKYTTSLGTTLHELGHCIDHTTRYSSRKKLTDAIDKAFKKSGTNKPKAEQFDGIPQEIKDGIKKAGEESDRYEEAYCKETHDKYIAINRELMATPYYDYAKRLPLEEEKAVALKAYKKALKRAVIHSKHASQGWSTVSDFIDAITHGIGSCGHGFGGTRPMCVWGHGPGQDAFGNPINRAAEIWADYCSLSMLYPDKIEMLEKYYPEIIESCRNLSKEIESNWKN